MTIHTTRLVLIVAALLGLFTSPSFAAEEVPTIVEGHVFNKWTGVPLSNAAIQIVSADEIGVQNNFVVRTDENGFYSAIIEPEYALVRMWASCGSRKNGLALNQISVPDPSVSMARRDAYLDVPRNRRFSTCIDIYTFGPVLQQ